MAKIEKVFELLNYLVLMMLIVGQCTVGSNFLIGQGVYLGANLISVSRCFILKRPIADKVKDCSCLAITCGLISIKLLGGIISQKGENKMLDYYSFLLGIYVGMLIILIGCVIMFKFWE